MRLHRAWFGQNLATLQVGTLNTTQQDANVVTSNALVESLLEHLNTGYSNLLGILAKSDDFNFIANFYNAAVNTTGAYSTTTLDREHIFNAHQEIEVFLAKRQWYVAVQCFHQFVDALASRIVFSFRLHDGQ